MSCNWWFINGAVMVSHYSQSMEQQQVVSVDVVIITTVCLPAVHLKYRLAEIHKLKRSSSILETFKKNGC